MSLLEAMAAARPVIATSVGAVPQLIEHNTTGYLIPPGDSEALAEGLLTLLRNRQLAQQLGQNGRQRVVDHFSANTMARQYSNVYRNVGIGCNEVAGAHKAEIN